MKIAVVSKSDVTGGGASRVAGDIAAAMRARGHDVTHFTAWNTKGVVQDSVEVFGSRAAKLGALTLGKAFRRAGFGETVPVELPFVAARLRGFDIIHLHDTSSAFSPLTVKTMSRLSSLVWTFHDCSPFTGGCIYPQMAGCERYKRSCGECPLKGEWPLDGALDTTRVAHAARSKLLISPRLTVVSPSDWMADVAFGSGRLAKRPSVISNMVDLDVFKPLDLGGKKALRRRLGLPEDRPVVSISAGNISDTRKNVTGSLDALAHLSGSDRPPTVVLIGKADPRVKEHLGSLEFAATGYVADRTQLSQWLAASDAFVMTSRADNQPLAVMEAMACGVPVYSWATGGVSEMVEDGISGRLFPADEERSIGDAVMRDFKSGEIVRFGTDARKRAEAAFGPALFADAHEALYHAIIKRN